MNEQGGQREGLYTMPIPIPMRIVTPSIGGADKHHHLSSNPPKPLERRLNDHNIVSTAYAHEHPSLRSMRVGRKPTTVSILHSTQSAQASSQRRWQQYEPPPPPPLQVIVIPSLPIPFLHPSLPTQPTPAHLHSTVPHVPYLKALSVTSKGLVRERVIQRRVGDVWVWGRNRFRHRGGGRDKFEWKRTARYCAFAVLILSVISFRFRLVFAEPVPVPAPAPFPEQLHEIHRPRLNLKQQV
ncbi:hypothetical protein FB446DRAFT_848993 [Lentinula raphanica]|nr:hypothetical protein FB446DRAFT_848993 [Lentinula raphanica]